MVVYSGLLFTKYFLGNEENIKTVVEGYFIINIFFGGLLVPISLLHNELKEKNIFLNVATIGKIMKFIS